MDVVAGAIGSLVPKLLQLLQDEYKLQKGVRKDLAFLSEELKLIHAALREVAEVPPDQLDETVRLWAREATEASYDMEDVLDTFLVRLDDGHDPASLKKLKLVTQKIGALLSKAYTRRNIAGAIGDIKKQVQEARERHARYAVNETGQTSRDNVDNYARLDTFREMSQLIGIDNSVGEIISMLQGDDMSSQITKIVSIVGVGGLGKTTVANAIYHKLKSQYDCGAFVSVGRTPDDLVKTFKDILYHLDKCKYENILRTAIDELQLIDELREFLKDKRYLSIISLPMCYYNFVSNSV
jgi:disease resistance protein RPM1